MLVCRVSLRRSRVCGGADYVEHKVGLRKHGDVTALELMGGRFHALCNKTFQLRVHGAVVLAHDVPARLRSPRGSFKLLIEEVRVWHALGRPNKFLFLLGQIPREDALVAVSSGDREEIATFARSLWQPPRRCSECRCGARRRDCIQDKYRSLHSACLRVRL